MNCRSLKILFSLVFLLFVLSGCAEQMKKAKQKRVFKHDTPLIKQDVKKLGKMEVAKSADSYLVINFKNQIKETSEPF